MRVISGGERVGDGRSGETGEGEDGDAEKEREETDIPTVRIDL